MIVADVVCPIYKGYSYLKPLYESFFRQRNIEINKVVFPITNSNDEEMNLIRKFVAEHNIISFEVEKDEFSHSLTRELAIKSYCESKIVIMLSQDIKIVNDDCFYNLVKDIDSGESVFNYAKQICTNKSIEKYIRQKNYPTNSAFIEKKDINNLGLMAFFASDACSAYNRDIFLKINGYNGYNVMMSEDMLYSKFVLDAGYKKKYCADAVVDHSHKYKLKDLYKRYKDTGIFYKKVGIFNDYKTTDSGLKLALYVLKQALKNFDLPVLLRWLPDMAARYLGMKAGRGQKI